MLALPNISTRRREDRVRVIEGFKVDLGVLLIMDGKGRHGGANDTKFLIC